MRRSRAELAAHLMKAARGVGAPLALAEDLYCAAPFLDLDDIVWIAEDLDTQGTRLCAMLSALDGVETGQMAQLPAVAGALAAARGWIFADGVKLPGQPEPQASAIDLPDELWARLDGYAAQTYVPESAASRARGAGAGAIDND